MVHLLRAVEFVFKPFRLTFELFFMKTHIALTTLEGKSFLMLRSHIISVSQGDATEEMIEKYGTGDKVTFLTIKDKNTETGRYEALFVKESFYSLRRKLS